MSIWTKISSFLGVKPARRRGDSKQTAKPVEIPHAKPASERAWNQPISSTSSNLPSVPSYKGPRTPKEEDRVRAQYLPVLVRNPGKGSPVIYIRASDLSPDARQTIIYYWIAVWDYLGEGNRVSPWSVGDFEETTIKGYELETSTDAILDYANANLLPSSSDDIYREI